MRNCKQLFIITKNRLLRLFLSHIQLVWSKKQACLPQCPKIWRLFLPLTLLFRIIDYLNKDVHSYIQCFHCLKFASILQKRQRLFSSVFPSAATYVCLKIDRSSMVQQCFTCVNMAVLCCYKEWTCASLSTNNSIIRPLSHLQQICT